MCFVFCSLYLSYPIHHGSYTCHLSTLNPNTVSPVRACLSIWLDRFCGGQKEDERGPLSKLYLCLMLLKFSNATSFIDWQLGTQLPRQTWLFSAPLEKVHWVFLQPWATPQIFNVRKLLLRLLLLKKERMTKKVHCVIGSRFNICS